jgi:hypothetical protein
MDIYAFVNRRRSVSEIGGARTYEESSEGARLMVELGLK